MTPSASGARARLSLRTRIFFACLACALALALPLGGLYPKFVTKTAKARGMLEIPQIGSRSHCMFSVPLQVGRDADVELVEQALLLGARRGHPAEADFAAVGRRQDDVRALQRRELGERSRRGEAGAATLEEVFQRHPERVAEKRDQDMGLHAVLVLTEQGTNRRLAFQGPERGFRLGLREKAASILHRGDISQMYIEARTGQRVVFDASLADRTQAGALNATAAVGEAIERQLGALSPRPSPAIVDAVGTGCKNPWAEYCRSMLAGMEFARQHGTRVLVATQPYLLGQSHARHLDQQATMLDAVRRRFGHDRGVAYFDAGPFVDLSDPAFSFDRMHLTASGNDRIARALVKPVIDLFASE